MFHQQPVSVPLDALTEAITASLARKLIMAALAVVMVLVYCQVLLDVMYPKGETVYQGPGPIPFPGRGHDAG